MGRWQKPNHALAAAWADAQHFPAGLQGVSTIDGASQQSGQCTAVLLGLMQKWECSPGRALGASIRVLIPGGNNYRHSRKR